MMALSRLCTTSVPVRRLFQQPVPHAQNFANFWANYEQSSVEIVKGNPFSTSCLWHCKSANEPTKVFVEEHFKVASFGGSVFVNAPFNVQVGFDYLHE